MGCIVVFSISVSVSESDMMITSGIFVVFLLFGWLIVLEWGWVGWKCDGGDGGISGNSVMYKYYNVIDWLYYFVIYK